MFEKILLDLFIDSMEKISELEGDSEKVESQPKEEVKKKTSPNKNTHKQRQRRN